MVSHLLLVGATTLVCYYLGEATRKLRLPSITWYMLVGVVLGPSVLGLFHEELLESLTFVTEIALGFVALTIGMELNLSLLRRYGLGIILIILFESFMAFFAVTVALYLWTGDLPLALVFGAMAPASAPAGTVAVIQEYRAKGSLTKALYAVVGFDDGLAILIYGFAAAAARWLLLHEAAMSTKSVIAGLWEPVREIGLSFAIGVVWGFVFRFMMRRIRTPRYILTVVFGSVLLITGLSTTLHISLILTNMLVGFVFVNTGRERVVHRVSERITESIMPIIFILFFFLAGAHLKLGQLPSLGMIGVIYIVFRSLGLIGGAKLGAAIGRMETKIRKYLGLGILSQAGVAIGLSLVAKQRLSAIATSHAIAVGEAVITTVAVTSIFFEIIGPILTKIALERAGEIGKAQLSEGAK